jgi:hypothetical protein
VDHKLPWKGVDSSFNHYNGIIDVPGVSSIEKDLTI